MLNDAVAYIGGAGSNFVDIFLFLLKKKKKPKKITK